MKISNILLIAFLILIFLLTTWFVVKAKYHVNTSYIEATGNTVTESVTIEPFNKVMVQGKFDVTIRQANEQRLDLTADENIISEVIAEVNNGALVIRLKSQIKDRDKVVVNLQVTELKSLEFSAGTNIKSQGEISGDRIDINSYAGSDGSLNLNYSSIYCDSKAGSSLQLSGKTDYIRINSSAGSRVKAQQLEANSCKVDGSAGSDVEVHVTNDLTASVSSGASLSYSGDPQNTNFNASAGGSIRKK